MLTLQQIADQIIADPTLRVVFVAATTSSAEGFLRKMARRLEAILEPSTRTTFSLCVSDWDKRNFTVQSVSRDGGAICGTRIDLLVVESDEAWPTPSKEDKDVYLSRLTQYGQVTFFNWACEPKPPA